MALMLASGCNVRGRGPRDASARHPGDRCCSRRHPLTALDRCIQRHLARSPLSCSNLNCGSSGAVGDHMAPRQEAAKGEDMKRLGASLALALIIAGLPISSASAGSSTGAAGYLVASASPLTAAQVTALTNAGAKVKYVYQNFGGAAVVASARSADAIRRLPFVTGNANSNQNQWDVGSDPHGMATAATVVGYRFVDDTNEGGWGVGYATGAA